MEETEERIMPPMERLAQMVLAEAICVAVLLLAAVAVKFVFKEYAETWYEQHLCVETDVDEVLSPEADDAV